MQAVIEVAAGYLADHPEVEKKEADGHEDETPEERADRLKKHLEIQELCRTAICDGAFAKACKWTDAEWANLEKAYKKYCR